MKGSRIVFTGPRVAVNKNDCIQLAKSNLTESKSVL
jgi:hypothetical protein